MLVQRTLGGGGLKVTVAMLLRVFGSRREDFGLVMHRPE